MSTESLWRLLHHSPHYSSRRDFLAHAGGGFGMVALSAMLQQEGLIAAAPEVNPLAPKRPHFPAKAKHVIYLFMNGGPSQVDTFDPKPALDKYHGKTLPTTL